MMQMFEDRLPLPVRDAVRHCRSHVVAALLFSALVNILYLAPTLYMMQVYDRVVPTGGVVTLVILTLVLGAAIATIGVLESLRSRLMVKVSLRLDQRVSRAILARLIERGHTRQRDPTTAQAMREFDTLRQVITAPTLVGIFDAPWTPIYVLAAVLIHPLLGLFIIAAGACLAVLTWMSERGTRGLMTVAHTANARSAIVQEDIAQQAELVRALGMGRAMVDRQIVERGDGQAALAAAQMATARYAAIAKFMRLFLQSLALGLAAVLAVERQISVGSIIAASVLLSRALQPVELLIGGWSNLQSANEALKSLKQLFDTDAAAAPATVLPAPLGRITARKVTTRSADGAAMLLKGVSFDLQAGQMLGIVGASGAGKTTLIRILAGGIAPEAGQVLLDGADSILWDAQRLARYRGYVPQEPGFLTGTVAQNIARFADPNAVDPVSFDRRVIDAAKVAGCHALILSLPGGYDCPIGRGGLALSAGQRQRIALARAMFDDPPILLLDEPNAALDAEGEAALMRALETSRQRGATIVIAAHRTSVLAAADRLLVLNAGSVDCEGPAEEVLAELARRAGGSRGNVVGLKGAVS
ncbi:type I secretion system permease/ATPase [Sphingomonas sp. STIS6.2]|uniref:type I secretion system permease/ATPase n=1 Tax=Sphingomonas sp. STIS6.2 TaxID=1379700 RepID=UPI000D143ADB|nr:type I secretion system permease/ATPase [Sphingomonas sp. STIS6.2]